MPGGSSPLRCQSLFGDVRNVIVPIVVLTPQLSASRASSSARRLPPARPEEVRRPRPRPPEPRPHVGGDSGAAGRRATGSGSAPPRRVCRASEVSFHHWLLALRPAPVLRTSAACLLMFFCPSLLRLDILHTVETWQRNFKRIVSSLFSIMCHTRRSSRCPCRLITANSTISPLFTASC